MDEGSQLGGNAKHKTVLVRGQICRVDSNLGAAGTALSGQSHVPHQGLSWILSPTTPSILLSIFFFFFYFFLENFLSWFNRNRTKRYSESHNQSYDH